MSQQTTSIGLERKRLEGWRTTKISDKLTFAPDSLIFDVDGVLIDVRASFPAMIRIAVEREWHSAGFEVDALGYCGEMNEVMKSHGAFNDDYDIVWILLNIAASRAEADLKLSSTLPAPLELVDILADCSDDYVAWVRRRFGERFHLAAVREAAAGIYFGKGDEQGAYLAETPLLRASWRDLPLPVYIYTGRDLEEWSLGQKTLSWEDFPEERVVHYGTGMRKPSPAGLDHLCRKFGQHAPLFFGDTMSDKRSHEAFGKGAFVAIGDILADESPWYPDVPSSLIDLIGWDENGSKR